MMVMCLGIFMMPAILNAKTVYVKSDASGANSGSSWANAYTDLQNAIDSTSSGDQVWVAAGTYKPTTGIDRSISFQMKSGVSIYGGFLGDEASIGQRDWNTNESILSGNIGAQGVDTDNSFSVITAINTAGIIIDGLKIQDGNATNGVSYAYGAGR